MKIFMVPKLKRVIRPKYVSKEFRTDSQKSRKSRGSSFSIQYKSKQKPLFTGPFWKAILYGCEVWQLNSNEETKLISG